MMSSKDQTDRERPTVEPQPEALGGVWSVYYRRGFEDGHRQAIQELLGSLVTVSEEFLGNGIGSEDARRLVYAFEQKIERRIEEIAGSAYPGGLPAPPSPDPPAAAAPPS